MTKEDILFDQRMLACGGFYHGDLDGLWGPKTQKAEQDSIAAYVTVKAALGAFDARTELALAGLMPKGQRMARQVMAVATARTAATGLTPRVLSGTRTYAEQDRLFAQRPRVTKAKGGQSNHNFGLAIDIGLFDAKGRYLTGSAKGDEDAYARLAAAVKSHVADKVFDWGGDWRSITDMPHYEVETGLSIGELRKQFEAGRFDGR
jgi:peptidoglycan L-alanyl-D-glutamate endopeptidase CwlK